MERSSSSTLPPAMGTIAGLLLGGFVQQIYVVGFPVMLSLHLLKMEWSASRSAWLMSLIYLGPILLRSWIGMWSDRVSTRWGRRRPFLLVCLPVWLLGMLLIPWAHSFVLMHIAVVLVTFSGTAFAVMEFFSSVPHLALRWLTLATLRSI